MRDKELDISRFVEFKKLGDKSQYFASLLSKVEAKCRDLGIADEKRIFDNLKKLWLPLALDLATKRHALDRTLIQGILGSQGTGKSTLCTILQLILHELGFSVATLSIDDLYLTYQERKNLRTKDQRLIWRGPPGTHDVELGLDVIEQCLQKDGSNTVSLPRFDKSLHDGEGDRLEAEVVTKPDILLFEGWFVGVRPIEESVFEHPPAPIITPEDKQFALDCNRRLLDYLPLWDKLDSLIILYLPDYSMSKQWRKDAEHQMIAKKRAEAGARENITNEEIEKIVGMSDEAINSFVEYFWQALHPELFIQPLIYTADWVIEINSDRTWKKTYNRYKTN